ncbi:MAG: gliding motility-associated C-terminal domain-containing protein [Bacteroidales bacterium]|nr:gliding motility-associated C-terminal domain-containing protein [Bacteroidales bacterium]
MNLKEFEYTPTDGVFEKIEKRLAVRQMVRNVVIAVGIVVVLGGVACAIVFSKDNVPLVIPNRHEMTTTTEILAEPQALPQKQETARVHHSGRKHVDAEKSIALQKQTADNMVDLSVANDINDNSTLTTSETQETGALKTNASNNATIVVTAEEKPLDKSADGTSQNTINNPKSEPDTTRIRRDFGTIAWVPNAIAPNDENEKNRVFCVKFTEYVSNFKIMIFNRAGRLVYESTDPEFVWNASSGSQAVGQGTYVWAMSFRDNQGVHHSERGTVTVIR